MSGATPKNTRRRRHGVLTEISSTFPAVTIGVIQIAPLDIAQRNFANFAMKLRRTDADIKFLKLL